MERGLKFLWVTALAVPLVGAVPQGGVNLLSTRVEVFTFHGYPSALSRAHFVNNGYPGTVPQAALALALHAGVRIVTEALPSGYDEIAVDIDARSRTVGDIFDELVRQDPRYEYRERLGVIELLPVGAGKDAQSCLNTVIPEFRVHYNFNDAWGNVRCELAILRGDLKASAADPMGELDPKTGHTCTPIGSRLSHAPPQPLQATFEQTPLRDILDRLVSMAGNVSWAATWTGKERSCKNLTLGLYQPTGWYPMDADSPSPTKPEDYIEGLPSKCTSCHYHEEQRKK